MTPELQEFAHRFLAVLERIAGAIEKQARRETMTAEPGGKPKKFYGQGAPNAETPRPKQAARS